jgi:ribosomal protein L11 methyltransferase
VSVAAPPAAWAALDLDAGEADAELVGRIAAEIGSPGAELRPSGAGSRWRLYLPEGDPEALSARVRDCWCAWSPGRIDPAPRLVREPERDWGAEARRAFAGADAEPFWIGPPWLDPPRGRTPVWILPGRAFGTGLHPTTRLALRLLGGRRAEGARVLDVGTGSGVLALAALARGARQAVGLDVDRHALANASGNALLNAAGDGLRLVAGSLDALAPSAAFDLVLANLERDALLPLLAPLRRVVAPGGVVVASGLTLAQRTELLAASAASGLSAGDEREEGGWWAALLRPA